MKFTATTPDGHTFERSSKTRTYTHARWIQFPWKDCQCIISWHLSGAAAQTSPFQSSTWRNLPWGIVQVS